MTNILSGALIGIYLIFQVSLILLADFSAKAYRENPKLKKETNWQLYIVNKRTQEKLLPKINPQPLSSLKECSPI